MLSIPCFNPTEIQGDCTHPEYCCRHHLKRLLAVHSSPYVQTAYADSGDCLCGALYYAVQYAGCAVRVGWPLQGRSHLSGMLEGADVVPRFPRPGTSIASADPGQ